MSHRRPTIGLLGALDTKGREYAHIRAIVEDAGADVALIDFGVLGSPTIEADVRREDVAAAGGATLDALRDRADRGASMQTMAAGAARIVSERVDAGELHGLLAVGGSNAAYVLAAVSEAVPVGFPKLLVSTIASGNTSEYIRDTDLTLMYSVVDINGLNRFTRPILDNAARAIVGMASGHGDAVASDAPLVGISMFGVTTACGAAIEQGLATHGVESLTFHATGAGGRGMEALIRSGYFRAVADVTTTELADNLVGGVCDAGPMRLTAAAETGVPQVVSVGALDMVNFWGRDTIPSRFEDRRFFEHNPTVTLMRTSVDECAELGRRLAEKLNASTAPVAVLFPLRGLSQLSVPDAPFHDREADAALLASLSSTLRDDIPLHEFETDINDPSIAAFAVDLIAGWLKAGEQ
ncbi:Tm-1-like ATP-binding domain-containing protein [Microbacterium aurantiacum]|uniref:Tm-1-like ATP-binding domain-containing protein n=1 Tax=Microbacterium aurantiacum TaxID=162393 RepID=UPI00403705BE